MRARNCLFLAIFPVSRTLAFKCGFPASAWITWKFVEMQNYGPRSRPAELESAFTIQLINSVTFNSRSTGLFCPSIFSIDCYWINDCKLYIRFRSRLYIKFTFSIFKILTTCTHNVLNNFNEV